MVDKYHFIITNLDANSIDLEDYQYGGANVTVLRMVDTSSEPVTEYAKYVTKKMEEEKQETTTPQPEDNGENNENEDEPPPEDDAESENKNAEASEPTPSEEKKGEEEEGIFYILKNFFELYIQF